MAALAPVKVECPVCRTSVPALALAICTEQSTPGVLTVEMDAAPFREHVLAHGPDGDGGLDAEGLSAALAALEPGASAI